MTERLSDCCGAPEHILRPGTCVTCGEHTSFGAAEADVIDTTLTDGDLGILRRGRVEKNAATLAELDALLKEARSEVMESFVVTVFHKPIFEKFDAAIAKVAELRGGTS